VQVRAGATVIVGGAAEPLPLPGSTTRADTVAEPLPLPGSTRAGPGAGGLPHAPTRPTTIIAAELRCMSRACNDGGRVGIPSSGLPARRRRPR
jgi:hypothetical protein